MGRGRLSTYPQDPQEKKESNKERRERLLLRLPSAGRHTGLVKGLHPNGWARTVGVNTTALTAWRAKKTIPSLWFLLLLCRRLGTTPLRLLQGDLGDLPAATTPDRSGDWFARRTVRPRTAIDFDTMRRGLEEILAGDEQPPPSLRQAA